MIIEKCIYKWIEEIYSKVDEYEKNNNAWAHHDLNHVMRIANMSEKLLEELGYNEEIIQSTKYACFLHDIGCIEGKKQHALRSYNMAKEYFESNNLKMKNHDEILGAIKEHSDGFESKNIITLTLLLVDKLDIDKHRIAPSGYLIRGMRQLQYINEIEIGIKNQLMEIKFCVNNSFDTEELEEFYFMNKVIKSVKSFCKVNNLNYVFLKNNKRWDIEKNSKENR